MTLNISRSLFDQLAASEVRHCHFKSNAHLDAALAGETDLDVLVDRAQATQCEAVLAGLGFKRFISQPWARFPGLEDWLGFDDETGELIHLHLHYKLVTGLRYVKDQHLRWEQVLLRTAVIEADHGVYVAAPAAELILLLVRIALKTPWNDLLRVSEEGYLPWNIRDELAYLRARATAAEVQEFSAELLPPELARLVCRVALDGGEERVVTGRELKRQVLLALGNGRYPDYGAALVRHYSQRASRFIASVQRKLGMPSQIAKRPHAGGCLIAVIGSDGAGKSSVTNELYSWLRWKIDSQRLYLGIHYDKARPHTRLLGRFARSTTSRGSGGPSTPRPADTAASSRSPRGVLGQIAKDLGVGLLGVSVAGERQRKVMHAKALRREGAVLVTDRYPQTQIRGFYDGPRIVRKASATWIRDHFAKVEDARFDAMTAVTPDLVLKLQVPTEVALERRPESDPAAIAQKVEATEALEFPGAQVYTIDATQPLDQVILMAKRIVWAHL